jgi:hypothetical protein
MEERTMHEIDEILSDITLVPVIQLSWGTNSMDMTPP